MPLIRRVPKRGFRNIFSKKIETVNIADLERFAAGTIVTGELLREHRLVRKGGDGVKILGDGELTKNLVVQVQAFSSKAKSKIEAAGGKAEVVT